MFTGIVEETGVVVGAGSRLVVECKVVLAGTKLGDSIAIDGCCLTVVEISSDRVAFDLGPETLAVTTLGTFSAGSRVHLERAVRVSDRLGGHMVQGHVDAVGSVAWTRREGDALIVRVEAPANVVRYCIAKGSVCVDGVSLTVNVVDERGFEVGLIPHTLEVTHFAGLAAGSRVNLEADVIGKYVERLLAGRI
jgi:riboflavin synthase